MCSTTSRMSLPYGLQDNFFTCNCVLPFRKRPSPKKRVGMIHINHNSFCRCWNCTVSLGFWLRGKVLVLSIKILTPPLWNVVFWGNLDVVVIWKKIVYTTSYNGLFWKDLISFFLEVSWSIIFTISLFLLGGVFTKSFFLSLQILAPSRHPQKKKKTTSKVTRNI